MTWQQDLARKIVRSEAFLSHIERAVEGQIDSVMAAQLGGCTLYVAKNSNREDLATRNKLICEQYVGNNLGELAKRYHLTGRQLRRIISARPPLKKK